MNLLYWQLLAIISGIHAFDFSESSEGFSLSIDGKLIFEHQISNSAIFYGVGETQFHEKLGNVDIEDYTSIRIPATSHSVFPDSCDESTKVNFFFGDEAKATLTLTQSPTKGVVMSFSFTGAEYNRVWLRIPSTPSEAVYGGGEQFTYFNLRGHKYPIWTREQGVGRNKSTLSTFYADRQEGAGGDYHTTYFPQPTIITSQKTSFHLTSYAYTVLDLTHSSYHEFEVHNYGSPFSLESDVGSSFLDLANRTGNRLGRQAPLPKWIYSGAILGVQGGTDKVLGYLKEAQDHQVAVSGLWIQDWTGRIVTSFGRRLFWDWLWDPKQYPNLDKEIVTLKEKGIGMFAYITPNLNVKGKLFPTADKEGYLIKNSSGQSYIMDFGEFYCGFIDLTNPAAVTWFKGVIKTNLIDFGFSGWMADFSEYTPVANAYFYSKEPAELVHNKMPYLWAKLNREAVEEAGKLGEILFWMRAGAAGTQGQSVTMWAGDQNVDFELSDGLASTIPAALSMTVTGMSLTHFDIGGYTSLFNFTRTKELLLRSAEMAVFTAFMRTHEGNRPDQNVQIYSDDDTWNKFSRLTRLYVHLYPYIQEVILNNSESSCGVQRPLFYHYPEDPESYNIKYQYLLGSELLVSPVISPNVTEWTVFLPHDIWVFVWGEKYIEYLGPDNVTVPAPIGQTPVFYRSMSPWADLFAGLKNVK